MDERERRAVTWERLRIIAAMAAVAFGVTLAALVGGRLSDQALAVLAGAVCGVGAALPTSLLIVAVVRRRDETRPPPPAQQPGVYPPVIVVAPPAGASRLPEVWNAPQAAPPRHFTIVGGAAEESERPAGF